MATANTYLQVTELDFDDIRNNLKTYLSSQEQFTDYNFEGSAMAVLLDILAYNTHYNSYYINMLANEMFLDTAQQRDSVVSHAKLLGYTPVSSIGATAEVTVSFSGVQSGVTNFTIPKNSKFTTTVDDITYTYVTPEAYKVTAQDGSYSRKISIKEGEPLTHRFTVSSVDDRFIIPNTNVDMTSIVVKVQESSTDTTTEEFTQATNISQVYSTSAVYFLEEASDEKYEVVFGSGSLGKSVKIGNIVTIEYLVNNGDATNGSSSFSIDTLNVGVNYSSSSIASVDVPARGGRLAETIQSIKFNAPRNYQTQNRCVVDNDYQRILLAENPDLESVIAFGGEQATPAVYGKVFIASKPYGENYVTELRKQQLKDSIKNRVPLAVDPVFIDADYTYIVPTITTYYDISNTTDTTGAIEQAVRNAISDFSDTNLGRFGNRLRYSRFVRALDNVSVGSIFNNDAKIKLQKRLTPNTNVAEKLEVRYNNPIRPSTVASSQFTYKGFLSYLDDDGLGNVRIYRFNADRQKVVIDQYAGSVDYDNGILIIENFAPSSYVDTFMKIDVSPDRLDIIPVREQILLMEIDDVNINLVGETS
jgi:hypothetical protein